MYSVLIYGFPLILLLFEWGLRTLLATDTSGFTGPTLAAAALSFLIPLTQPKIIDVQTENGKNYIITSRYDSNIIAITWILILTCLFAWASACYISIKYPSANFFGFAIHLLIGAIAYLISLIMTAFKETA